MKNKIKSFALLAAVAGLVACEEVGVYETAPFVSMDVRTAVVEESNPATVWSLPVHLYNYGSATTVTYTVEAVTATAGVDYTVADGSGVLNFTGNDTQNISVSVTGQPGVYTGNLTFQIKLASATNDVQLGAVSTCTVTIKDKDHPLVAMFGEYTMCGVTYSDQFLYPEWTMTISPVEGSLTMIQIDHITPFSLAYEAYVGPMPVVGTVSADMKKITFATPQQTGDASAFDLEGPFSFYSHGGFNGAYITDPAVVTFTLDEATGRWTTTDSFGFSHPDDVVDYPVLFYDYAVIFSDASPSLPTYFKKK